MLKESEHIAISKKPKRQQLYNLYKLIVNRKMLEYTTYHIYEQYFRCLCYKSRHKLKNSNLSKIGKRHVYFRKAKERLNNDLDIAGLLEVRYGFEILKSILFDEDE